MINIAFENDGFEDVFVTAYDLRTANNAMVLNQARVNVGASVGVYVQNDSDDRGCVRWQSVGAQDRTRTKEGTTEVQVGEMVQVGV